LEDYNIYIIVGASCAGKTTIVSNNFLNDDTFDEYKDIVWVSETPKYYIIGRYSIDKRTKGTDAIARQDYYKIPDQVFRLLEKGDKPVVIEGLHFCMHKFFEQIVNSNAKCKMILVECDLQTSIDRNAENGATISDSRLKGFRTMSRNFYDKYGKFFDGEVIRTDGMSYDEIKSINLSRIMVK